MTWTLGSYIARRFLMTTLMTFLGIFVLVVLVDLVELNRTNREGVAGFATMLGMAMLRTPAVTITAAPFIILLAAMTTFARLARSSELVVTRAAGVSVWATLTPAVLSAVLLGVGVFALYNPLTSAFASRFETLEARYFDNMRSRLSVSADGLWLRQGDADGQTVIRAQRASSTADRLWDVSVFQFGTDDELDRRIDARTAVLEDGAWRLNLVRRWDISRLRGDEATPAEARAEQVDEMRIPTDLTTDRIVDGFAPPETISFWQLPGFIRVLEEAGFSSNRHRLHFQSLLAVPVIFAAMVLIGAAFSMRHVRFGGLGLMALGCLLCGFAYFFLSDIAAALGASGSIPPELAAWGPPASAVLFSLGLLLHLEDG